MRDLRAWQERLERLVRHPPTAGRRRSTSTRRPTRYVVTAEVPGLSREHVELARRGVAARRSAGRARSAARRRRRGALSTRSSAATARSRARSSSPIRSTATDHRRSDRRRADRHAAEGAAAAAAQDRGPLISAGSTPCSGALRRLSSITIGFVAGLVLTGRMRTAEETSAAAGRRAAGRGAAAGAARAGRRPPALPDLTGVAQRAISSVTNISSTQVVRARTRRSRTTRSSATSSATTTFGIASGARRASAPASSCRRDGYVLTNNHVVGSAGAEVSRRCSATSASCRAKVDRHRPAHRPRGAEDRRRRTCRRCRWGDSSKLQGRRVGAGDRQPVPAEPDRHARHRQRDRPAASRAGSRPTRTSSRPTPPSTRATPAARWSTRAASWSASTPRSTARSGGYQGIGFAVPSNLARHVMDDLIKYGEVQPRHDPRHPAAAADARRSPSSSARPNARGVLVVGDASALGRLRRRPAPGRHHRQLQRHDRSRTRRSSSGCCPTPTIGTHASRSASLREGRARRSVKVAGRARSTGAPDDACDDAASERQPPARAGVRVRCLDCPTPRRCRPRQQRHCVLDADADPDRAAPRARRARGRPRSSMRSAADGQIAAGSAAA